MQERHSDRKLYFDEQAFTTLKYVIPFINTVVPVTSDMHVGEIGCGEGGNLRPFLDMGCRITGIDLSKGKIEDGYKFYEDHPNRAKMNLIAQDIYKIETSEDMKFDLIIMRDTLEHIHNQEKLIGELGRFLKPGGHIFFGFPPWRMPFGGHQQMCFNKKLGMVPWMHLLPRGMYAAILRGFGEPPGKLDELMDVVDTQISINRFKRLMRESIFKVDAERLYVINPNYEIKFKLKPRVVMPIFNIFWLRDFYITTCYYIISVK